MSNRILNQYKEYLFDGEWHIHTNFTDGKNTILDYVEVASKLKIPLLAFTEHVRKDINYNYNDFLKEIDFAKKHFPNIILLSGFEAKVLPNGELDCPEDVYEKADYRIFAYHSFPKNLEIYVSSIEKIITNYNVDTWAHPGLFFEKHKNLKLSEEQLTQIFELMDVHNILLEFNFKYSLPKTDWISEFQRISNKENIIYGLDAHSTDDLYRIRKIKNQFMNYFEIKYPHKIDIITFINWFIEKPYE